jgi:hypothetical protein
MDELPALQFISWAATAQELLDAYDGITDPGGTDLVFRSSVGGDDRAAGPRQP